DRRAEELALTRLPALKTQGLITFSRASGAGNLPVSANGVVASDLDAEGRRYRYVVTETVVAASGQTSIQVPVEAEEEGAAHNLGAGQITQMVTPFPGWETVTNPSGWITREGRDQEADGRVLQPGESATATTGLRLRIGLKRISGNNCNWAAYKLWALSAGAHDCLVTQIRPDPGAVDLYVSGPAGPPSQELIAAVEAALSDPAFGPPATDDWMVNPIRTKEIDYDIDLIMYPGQAGDPAGLIAQATTILNALHNPSISVGNVSALKIGQDVVLQQVSLALRLGGLIGLKRADFDSPSADVAVAEAELAVIGQTPVINVIEDSEE
ncbi:MAG: baseplate J/gp47 family protein, partial [Thermodesulfobacteriota bacterium]